MKLKILIISADFDIFKAMQKFLYPTYQPRNIVMCNTDVLEKAMEFLRTQEPSFVLVDDNTRQRLEPILQATRFLKFTLIRVKPDTEFSKNPVKGWGPDYTIPKPIQESDLKKIILKDPQHQTA